MLLVLLFAVLSLARSASIDVADWKRHTIVENLTPAHEPLIEHLFEILADDAPLSINDELTLTAEEKRSKFLLFVTGTSCPPATGFSDMIFKIACYDSTDMPLMAHTCFSTVDLSICSKEQLLEYFKCAVGSDFFFY